MANEENMQSAADDEWLEDEPKRRGGIPGWAKFCGCGCLVAVLLVGGLGWKISRDWQRGMDQEVQRAELATLIPYDSLPSEFTILGLPWFLDLWVVNDTRGYMWAFLDLGTGESFDLETFFSSDASVEDPLFGFQNAENVVLDEVVVQGRPLRVKRFEQSGSDMLRSMSGTMPNPKESDGASALIDLSAGSGSEKLVLLIVKVDAKEQISNEELQELLAPFQIGPDHVPYVEAPKSTAEPEADPEPEGEDGR